MELSYADYCHAEGGTGFRQRDLIARVEYDADYVRSRYAAIDDRVKQLSGRRLQVLQAFWPWTGRLLDFGCGTNRFAQLARGGGWQAFGYDVVPGGEWPRLTGSQVLGPVDWDVVTFFDSLEHLPRPASAITSLRPRCVMVSVPECHRPDDPEWFMAWRHRRPGEHLWHWNRHTLDRWFAALGYRPLMHSTFEDEFRPGDDKDLTNILSAIYVRG